MDSRPMNARGSFKGGLPFLVAGLAVAPVHEATDAARQRHATVMAGLPVVRSEALGFRGYPHRRRSPPQPHEHPRQREEHGEQRASPHGRREQRALVPREPVFPVELRGRVGLLAAHLSLIRGSLVSYMIMSQPVSAWGA